MSSKLNTNINTIMKFLCSLLIVFFISSCNNKGKKDTLKNTSELNQKETINHTPKPILFNSVNSQGVLIGKKIMLLNESLKTIKDISIDNESFVQITAISNSNYKKNKDDDYCESFKYVKIKSKDFEGIIDGRFIFEPVKESSQNKKSEDIQFVTTSYFGIGPFEDDDISGCIEIGPTLLIGNKTETKYLVYMVRNKYYDSKYPYFSLNTDSEIWDNIVTIKKVAKKYQLQIKRTHQDSEELITLEIQKNKQEKYLAEIIHIKKNILR